MALKKPLLVASGVFAIGIASLGVISSASADTGNGSLAQKIAQKFNLNQDEVESVLEEHHEQKKAEHKQDRSEKLSQAVSDGKITEEQKDKIVAKIEEFDSEREASKGKAKQMSKEERKAMMDTKRNELKEWADQNDIPEEALHYLMPHRRHGGPGPQ